MTPEKTPDEAQTAQPLVESEQHQTVETEQQRQERAIALTRFAIEVSRVQL